jgi:hypothetical protein
MIDGEGILLMADLRLQERWQGDAVQCTAMPDPNLIIKTQFATADTKVGAGRHTTILQYLMPHSELNTHSYRLGMQYQTAPKT